MAFDSELAPTPWRRCPIKKKAYNESYYARHKDDEGFKEKIRLRSQAQKVRINSDPDLLERERAKRRAYLAENAAARSARNIAKTSSFEGWAKKKIQGLKSRAKTLGLPFDLSVEDLQIPEVCPVLGIPITRSTRRTRRPGRKGGPVNPNAASVDRFDNAQGYVSGNVRVISQRANQLKNNATADEIRRVLEYVEGER